jgi:REP element-mobilizing transposase RayT
MANTYTQIFIHIVFVVKGRQNLIPRVHKEELHKFITGIITKRGQKLLAIHCMPDHTHVFIGIKPDISVSDLARDIKSGSSKFLNRKLWMNKKFQWQKGFGAFSYASSQLSNVINYIDNQEQHHAEKTFRQEYHTFLEKFNVEYDEQYLFEFIE